MGMGPWGSETAAVASRFQPCFSGSAADSALGNLWGSAHTDAGSARKLDDNFGKEARHGGNNYQQFFLRPEDSVHRRYESLRAVFVDGLAMADVAKRFGVAYGTVRNWAHEFRVMCV